MNSAAIIYPVFYFIPLAILAVTLFFAASAGDRKRREELSTWAARHALSYESDDVYYFDDRFGGGFPCLRRGEEQHASKVMKGDWGGRQVIAFDYQYESNPYPNKRKSNTIYHRFSAVAIESAIPLKSLTIRPRRLLDKIGAFAGGDDINFESAEFSRRFSVKSGVRKWAYDVLHARAIEILLGRPEFSIQFHEKWTLAWRDKRFTPADFDDAAAILSALLDALPDYVVQDGIAQAERSAKWDRAHPH